MSNSNANKISPADAAVQGKNDAQQGISLSPQQPNESDDAYCQRQAAYNNQKNQLDQQEKEGKL